MQFTDIIVRLTADWLIIQMIGIAAWALWRVPKKQQRTAVLRAGAMLLVAYLFAKIASLAYSGARPFVLLGVEPGASYINNSGFPSDHALVVSCLTLIVWVVTRNRRLTAWMAAMAVLVMAARVVALVHTPLDVIGGVVCAVLAGLCVYGRNLLGRS